MIHTSKQMASQDLREELIRISNELDRTTSRLMLPKTVDIETGEHRADAYTVLFNCVEQLKDIAYDIY